MEIVPGMTSSPLEHDKSKILEETNTNHSSGPTSYIVSRQTDKSNVKDDLYEPKSGEKTDEITRR